MKVTYGGSAPLKAVNLNNKRLSNYDQREMEKRWEEMGAIPKSHVITRVEKTLVLVRKEARQLVMLSALLEKGTSCSSIHQRVGASS